MALSRFTCNHLLAPGSADVDRTDDHYWRMLRIAELFDFELGTWFKNERPWVRPVEITELQAVGSYPGNSLMPHKYVLLSEKRRTKSSDLELDFHGLLENNGYSLRKCPGYYLGTLEKRSLDSYCKALSKLDHTLRRMVRRRSLPEDGE